LNLIFEVDFAVFSVFAALLITEIMGSILMLFFYEATKKAVLQYIVPIWEVTGTFGAFWIVTSYFAFPNLLIPVAEVFAGLLVVFLILIVARNSSIVFGEFIIKRRWLDEKKLYRAYASSTLLLGIIVLILLSALISGRGINLTTDTFSIGAWAASPGSVVFVVGTLVLGLGLAPAFFDLRQMKNRALLLTVLGVGISIAAYDLYSPSLISTLIVIPSAIAILTATLFSVSSRTARVVTNKAVFIALLCIAIFSLQFLVYPSALGRSLPIDSVILTGVTVQEFTLLTSFGVVFIGALIAFYMFIAMRQKIQNKPTQRQSKN
jgi:cytochrome bd ubiquinol oxidase subunit II